ncbi:MAG: YidC/Oxa1 family membrane protein insertase [Spirochaetaceae bacterium]|jgi:YidC/Oxa1 family membrane protein insertase|nr:YidC/Oxa1 family membrane protein insertase [Spirochaetaceae bacterium]
MANVLYTLIIFPLKAVIELAYLFVWRIFRDPAAAVVGVSAAVSVLTLPLYFMAERHQQAERAVQKRLKPKADKIRAVFRGDERYMVLTAWYRQNGYHPVYALRGSLGLIIQLPFFIAAYDFIANLEDLKNVSFLFVKDLSVSDAAFHIGSFPVNVLPLVMTAVSVVSGAIYAKNLGTKDKAQLYGMSAVFLLLLYNAPAGLALYWTCNTFFSLVKNILQKTKYAGRVVYIAYCAIALVVSGYALFFHEGALNKRVILSLALLTAAAVPLIARRIKTAAWRPGGMCLTAENAAAGGTETFVYASAALFLLAGLVTPSTVIASSVAEFSFLDPYASPLPFIGLTLAQSAGIFLFWAPGLYALCSRTARAALTVCMTVFCYIAAVNTFVFQGYYGFLTPDLRFSNEVRSSAVMTVVNIPALVFTAGLAVFLLFSRRKRFLAALQNITVIAFLLLGGFNVFKIADEYAKLSPVKQETAASAGDLKKVYTFSKTGQNVLLIMLDRGISGYVPFIFSEKPELADSFAGFTYYPNTVSFGSHTLIGAPGLYGGYEYTPLEMQKNQDVPLADRHDQALMVLPRLFAENGFRVTVSNQPLVNPRAYENEPGINVENITGRYTDYYLAKRPDLNLNHYSPLLEAGLVRFSFFKFAPLVLRNFCYDNGDYLLPDATHLISTTTIDNYTALAALPEITAVAEEGRNFIILNNELTHDSAFFEAPSYEPVTVVTNRGSGPFANEEPFHANMAAFVLLGKWFRFLKENGVYDNTRIIIVSDHGFDFAVQKNAKRLPNRERLELYWAMMLVKDFDAPGMRGESLPVDRAFMTNADAPILATQDGIVTPPPRNPFTGIPLVSNKDQGVTITTTHLWEIRKHAKNTFNIKPDEWLHVRGNIFDVENWSRVRQ